MSSRPLAQKSYLTEKIGADEVIDYHTTNFAEVLTDVDLVFDTMGGEVQKIVLPS